MSEQRLHGADVLAGFQQVGREAVPEAVRGEADGESGLAHSRLDGALENPIAPPRTVVADIGNTDRQLLRRGQIHPVVTLFIRFIQRFIRNDVFTEFPC